MASASESTNVRCPVRGCSIFLVGDVWLYIKSITPWYRFENMLTDSTQGQAFHVIFTIILVVATCGATGRAPASDGQEGWS